MILVFPFGYAEAVLDGHAGHGVDILSSAHAADPTNINELRLCFLYPEWPSGRWTGMRAKTPQHVARMLSLKSEGQDGIEHMASDGAEYIESLPEPIYSQVPGEPEPKLTGFKRFPWKRTSEKIRHPGRARRAEKGQIAFEDSLV